MIGTAAGISIVIHAYFIVIGKPEPDAAHSIEMFIIAIAICLDVIFRSRKFWGVLFEN